MDDTGVKYNMDIKTWVLESSKLDQGIKWFANSK